MSQQSPYATNKLLAHPDHIKYLAAGEHVAPLQIQLSPIDLCDSSCHFCSYRLENWKNSTLFDEKSSIPLPILDSLLDDAIDMGVKAFEVTGGGEPLIYPHREHLFNRLFDAGLDVGLVTNGVALTDKMAELISERLLWSRVSHDSVHPDRYAKIRSVDEKKAHLGWAAVRKLAAGRKREEQRVGVGFVLLNENIDEVYEFCSFAREQGADNVRLSLRFGPGGNDYYTDKDALFRAFDDADRAKSELDGEGFQVNNLLRERYDNQHAATQDYNRCLSKDLMTFIGGTAKVWMCCTLAYHPSGYVGDLREKSFKDLWFSAETEKLYRNLDPRFWCRWTCLYEFRNKEMLKIVNAPQEMIHKNFI